eukprot:PhF_6_TR15653/c0_g2_i1/m.24324
MYETVHPELMLACHPGFLPPTRKFIISLSRFRSPFLPHPFRPDTNSEYHFKVPRLVPQVALCFFVAVSHICVLTKHGIECVGKANLSCKESMQVDKFGQDFFQTRKSHISI